MTGNPQTNMPAPSQQGGPSDPRCEVLYGTESFQVRIWHLSSGSGLARYPQASITESQNLLIGGKLSLGGEPLPEQPAIGKRFTFNGASTANLQNDGPAPAILLEVCWGTGFEPIPQKEVTETRPWGTFTVLKDEPDYKLKQLTVNPGNRLSLQRHQKREEHWMIIHGDPEVTLDDTKVLLGPHQYIHIPRHSWHRIANPGLGTGETVEIIELQLGDYFGEEDIERREDDYGRV